MTRSRFAASPGANRGRRDAGTAAGSGGSTASLSSADEVERYVEALRVQLLDALNSGNDTVVVNG